MRVSSQDESQRWRACTAVWRIEGARMVLVDVTESGRKTIAARIFLATGRELPWLNKCQ
jgi:hypothetical protein